MSRFMSGISKNFLFLSVRIFNGMVALVAIILLSWSGAYIKKPGPNVYYSHFTGLYFSSCLIFQTIQNFLLVSGRTRTFRNCWYLRCTYIYWTTLALSGFMCGVGYSFTLKPDVIAIHFLIFLNGLTGVTSLFLRRVRAKGGSVQGHVEDTRVLSSEVETDDYAMLRENIHGPETSLNRVDPGSGRPASTRQPNRVSGYCLPFWKVFNRFLKFVHWAMSVMFIAGAVTLALSYRFTNPGKIVQVKLPTGQSRSLNYNCTTVPSNSTSLPTIWFEASDAHGIVDFLGVQHLLAIVHGRNSCSYDPPNFGWSDDLLSSLPNRYSYFNPLLEALGRQDEDKIIVGWGDGAHIGLVHVNDNPRTTKAFVMLDSAPDGIEWFDMQRKHNWNEEQLQNYKALDLSGRAALTQIILTLGISWGLMPIFIPNNPEGYFDKTLFQRYRSQGFKEDFWALQYFGILRMAAEPIDKYLVTATVPSGIPTYTVMTDVPGDTADEKASNDYYLTRKLEMANHIAGGNLTKPPVFCADSDCTQGFPVDKVEFTANALIGFGI